MGRYFDALLLLLIPLAAGSLALDDSTWNRGKLLAAITVPVALLFATFLIWNRYYFHLNLS